MRVYPFKGQDQIVYDSIDEANKAGIEPLGPGMWRAAKQGDWITTDDGCVAQVLRRWQAILRIATGSFTVYMDGIDTQLREDPYRVMARKRRGADFREFAQVPKYVHDVIRWLVDNRTTQVIKTGITRKLAIEATKAVLNKNLNTTSINRLAHSEKVKRLLITELVKALDQHGITDQFLFGEVIKLITAVKTPDTVRWDALKHCIALRYPEERPGLRGRAIEGEFSIIAEQERLDRELGPAEAEEVTSDATQETGNT